MDWNRYLAVGEGLRLEDLKLDNFLHQMVREPTQGENVLDLIFSTEEDLISEVEVGEALAGSDHNTVQCMVGLPSDQEVNRTRERWNPRRADYDNFLRDLFELPRPVVGPAEDMWAAFRQNFLDIQIRRIPCKRIGGKNCTNPSWFNGGISREIKKLYQEAKRHPTPEAECHLTIQRRVVKKMIRQVKVAEEHRVAFSCKDNPMEFFGYVNKQRPRAPLGPVLSDNGQLLTSDRDIATEFNNYFSSVFTVENMNNIPDPVVVHAGDTLRSIDCHEPGILEKLKDLKPDKAPGPDGFLPRVLKAVADGVAPHLCPIFNRSLATGDVPSDLRSADVCPIHKKGPLQQKGNFRPISLTTVVSKVLESIIKDRIVDHLDVHQLLNTSQHGFRRGRSCITNLLDFYNNVFCECDRSRAMDVVFLDFQKAFDKVPHRRLMKKVRALGIVDNVATWIESWL